jgi:O-antigen ligase
MFKMDIIPRTEITATFYSISIIIAIIGLLLRHYKQHLVFMDIMIFLFLVWLAVSFLIFSSDNSAALKKLLYGPVLFIAPFCAGRLFHNSSEWKRFADYVLILSKILLVIFVIEMITSHNQQVRLTVISFGNGTYENPILVGATFSMAFLVLYNRLPATTSFWSVLHSFSWLLGFLFMMIKAASRGVLFSLILSILLLHILRGIRLKQALGILATVVFALLMFVNLPHDTINFYSSTFNVLDNADKFDSTNSASIRLALWKMALQKISANPIVGSGFAQSDMSENLGYTSDPIYPHNIFLEVAVELGLIGVILFTIPLFIGIKRAYYSFQYVNPAKGIDVDLVLLLFVFSFIEAQLSGFLTNQAQLLFMMGISGSLYRWKVIPQHMPRKNERGMIFRTVASYYQHSNHTLMRNKESYEN